MEGAIESVALAAPAPARRHNYLLRHWRGELSLGVSFWVNGWLGDIPVVLLALGTALAARIPGWLDAAMIGGAASWAIAVLVSIWQLVGIWRSAGRHVGRGGRRLWARLAQASVVLGVVSIVMQLYTSALPQLLEFARIWNGDKALAWHRVWLLRGGTELAYSGFITFGAASEVRHVLDQAPQVRVLHLESPGGRLIAARRLRDLVAARGLDTYVSTFCASACTTVFMGGHRRFLAPGARLGFHQVSADGSSFLTTMIETAEERAALRRAGVSAEFVARAYAAPPSGMWYPSAAELLRAHVVTALAAPGQFAADR